ncbi:hypothetical protein B566_EDAN011733 [Ephemera danica]|nr:hypothetical protein B566_EDAN011733 [Ephemera danica]
MSPQQPPRLSGLCLFVAAYVSLFAIAGVLLFGPGIFPSRHNQHTTVHPDQFPHGLRWPYAGNGLLNCTSLRDVAQLEFIASGWTKAVYRGKLAGNRDVAVKTVNLNGHELQVCQARGETLPECYSRAAAKLMREMILLTELAHDNMIKVLGSCVPEGPGPVAVLTELGEPLDTVRLLQLGWEDRLQLALGVARILQLLAHSPLGSLAMNDFRRQQFVLVNGVLKLSDVDDVGLEEPACDVSMDCDRHLPEALQQLALTRCETGRCRGHNERVNVWHAGKHFIRHLLPLGAPAALKPRIRELLDGYADASWSARHVLAATEELVRVFSEGKHLPPDLSPDRLKGYKILKDRDLPGEFDYACAESRSAVTCVRSVHSPAEAAQLCDADPRCQSVVIGPHRTWTGRLLAVFKTGVGVGSLARGYQLLVKTAAPSA